MMIIIIVIIIIVIIIIMIINRYNGNNLYLETVLHSQTQDSILCVALEVYIYQLPIRPQGYIL